MKKSFSSSLALLTLFTISLGPVQALECETKDLKVAIDEGSGRITLTSSQPGRKGQTLIELAGVKGAKSSTPITDTTWGPGQEVELTGPQGPVGHLRMFPSLPFVLVQSIFSNPGSEPVVRDKVPVATLRVKLNQPVAELNTLGTGGLMKANQKPGSYVWLAVAEPQSREGVVAAWLTHERAGGTLFGSVDGDAVKIETRSEYGTLRLAPGARSTSETLAVGLFADTRLGLEAWAEAVAKGDQIKLRPRPSGYCTWYAEKNGRGGNAASIKELAEFTGRELKAHGFGFVQIDDGWQLGESKTGPKKNFTAHNPKGGYPAGMKATADEIKAQGLTPGIWFMPFAGNYDDPWFADHQEWFVKRKNCQPFSSKWSAACLDLSQPGARDYVRSFVSRIAHEWGYTYFKMDGFHTGAGTSNIYVNAGYKEDDLSDAVFSDPNKTNIEIYRSGIRLVREAAGPEVFFLGCCITQNMRSYEGTFGLLDAMRVGPDNTGNWAGWSGASPVFGSRHYFENGRIWWVDPDPTYVRPSLSLDEARTTATWTALAGQLYANSDWIPGLPPERLEILRRTLASHQAVARPVDFLENNVPRLWLVTDGTGAARRDVVGLYNWSNEETTLETTPERLGLAPAASYAAFDFWANTFLSPITTSLQSKLAPHACQALAIRPMLDRPFLLSTSRHVTQGMIEVSGETWDAGRKTLSGRSAVVAGDAYELRVVVPAPWKTVKVDGGNFSFEQKGSQLRASFTPAKTTTVEWKIRFE